MFAMTLPVAGHELSGRIAGEPLNSLRTCLGDSSVYERGGVMNSHLGPVARLSLRSSVTSG